MKIFEHQKTSCALVGMIHLKALPGTPSSELSLSAISDAALEDALILADNGCDAAIIENMADLPYLRGSVGPEIVASAAIVARRIREALELPLGLQILAAANIEAMAVATMAGLDFIRAEAFAYAHVADEGWLDACAAPLLRYRKMLGSRVKVWADIQKKHSSHAVTGDLSVGDWAHGFQFCGADALIVTGKATGSSALIDDVREARSARLPVAVGSGIDHRNIRDFAAYADAVIVGTSIKEDGLWQNKVCAKRVAELRHALDTL